MGYIKRSLSHKQLSKHQLEHDNSLLFTCRFTFLINFQTFLDRLHLCLDSMLLANLGGVLIPSLALAGLSAANIIVSAKHYSINCLFLNSSFYKCVTIHYRTLLKLITARHPPHYCLISPQENANTDPSAGFHHSRTSHQRSHFWSSFQQCQFLNPWPRRYRHPNWSHPHF